MDEGTEGHIPLSALRPVHRAIAKVNTAVGLDETLQAIADGVTACTPFELVAVNVVEDDETSMRCLVTAGSDEMREALLGQTCNLKSIFEIFEHSEAWGGLYFVRDISAVAPSDIDVYRPVIEERPDDPDAWLPDYELFAPMRDTDGEFVGMISVSVPADGKMPQPWVAEVLEMFTEQAAIAITNARRHEEAARRLERLEKERQALKDDLAERLEREKHLRHQARHDALTGLANPVELNERLVGLVAAQVPVAVIFCDLDRFKEINDTRGHAVGDVVLRTVALRLREVVRGEDVVARVGGDEFVVVVGGIGPDEALALMDRVDQAFSHPVSVEGHRLLVKASLGLRYEPARPENSLASAERAHELLEDADREMYARKRSRAALTRMTMRAWARKASVNG